MNKLTTLVAARDDEPGFSRAVFMRLCESGAFNEGAKVELVEGKIEQMAPSFAEHGRMQMEVGALLRAAYAGLPFFVAGDLAVTTAERTIRAPDVAVARASAPMREAVDGNNVLLAVEISMSTLRRDWAEKPIEYATAGIAHYWIVDLQARVIHEFSEPQDGTYQRRQAIRFGEPVLVPETEQSITID